MQKCPQLAGLRQGATSSAAELQTTEDREKQGLKPNIFLVN
jgi:hypothetical protein